MEVLKAQLEMDLQALDWLAQQALQVKLARQAELVQQALQAQLLDLVPQAQLLPPLALLLLSYSQRQDQIRCSIPYKKVKLGRHCFCQSTSIYNLNTLYLSPQVQ